MKLNIDKSEWTQVSFGDVAKKQNGKVDRDNTKLTKYVKGEHLNSEDLHIRSHGTLTDEYLGPAFTRSFEPGDILYGSRRTYLRKVAVADFEGITSNTTFVIKANPELIEPRLLPFVMLSEGFAQHSIRNSKGSVNPYVNWKDISNYQFLLPPKPEQTRLAELLWAGDEVLEVLERVKSRVVVQCNALFNETVYKPLEKRSFVPSKRKSFFPILPLKKVLDKTEYGVSFPMEEKGEVPVLRMNAIQNGRIVMDNLKYYTPIADELDNLMLKKNDVLFNRTNSFDLVGKVGIYTHDVVCSFASYLIRLIPKSEMLDSRYLARYLNSFIGEAFVRMYRTPGVNQSNINTKNLARVLMPVPPVKIQEELMDKISTLEEVGDETKTVALSTRALQKSLINQIF